MRVIGELDLAKNLLKNFKLEQLSNFPSDATPGTFIFKDKRVMVCVELDNSVPIWVPLTQEIATYIHDQPTNASTWVISHDFNAAIVMVQVFDEFNKMVIPNEIDCSVENQVTIYFSSASRGKAVIMLGATDGTAKPDIAYEEDFSSSTTWVVSHGLGYNPEIRVFISGQEVQPLSIVHDSTTQTTVTFSSSQSGTVRCI